MTEKFFHYLWQFQFYNKSDLRTTKGEEITIIFPGTLNTNQGPDFKEARIKIGNTLLAGAVELHLNASDWQKHGHENDPNYKPVILHVVFQNDVPESHLPVLELQPRIPQMLLEKYASLMEGASFIPCAASIASVSDIVWLSWKERLVAERLTRKADLVFNILKETNGHWEETFWRLLARNFGTKVNGEAFEKIAGHIPINMLARHKSSIHQIEALLLGQAGLLEGEFKDEYPKLLQREFKFLQKKYGLKPLHFPIHFLRMRPYNFPTIRLAQLAMLVHHSSHLFSKVVEAETLEEVKSWLSVTANDYWHYHFRLDELSTFKKKNIGDDMITNIIINTIIPVLFAYGLHKGEEGPKLKALNWLEKLGGENNKIVNGFSLLSIGNKNAFDSQALIELKNEYCNHKKCLDCGVGVSLLKKTHTTSSS